jgi:hypothetical protein
VNLNNRTTNNMKKTILTLAAIASLTIATQAGDNNQTGRYQMVVADVDHSGKQTVFKIDTITGQPWTYTEACVKPVSHEVDPDNPPKDLPPNTVIAVPPPLRFWSLINQQPPTGLLDVTVGRP